MGEAKLVDQSGRTLGPRAAETRQRLLDATEELLATRKLRDLRVIDVARRVGTSPATFYQYFEDLEAAVLELAERAALEVPAIVAEIGGSFDGAAPPEVLVLRRQRGKQAEGRLRSSAQAAVPVRVRSRMRAEVSTRCSRVTPTARSAGW